jgi:hypothetical protein
MLSYVSNSMQRFFDLMFDIFWLFGHRDNSLVMHCKSMSFIYHNRYTLDSK